MRWIRVSTSGDSASNPLGAALSHYPRAIAWEHADLGVSVRLPVWVGSQVRWVMVPLEQVLRDYVAECISVDGTEYTDLF